MAGKTLGLCKEAKGKLQWAILFRNASCLRKQTERPRKIIWFCEIIAFYFLHLITQPLLVECLLFRVREQGVFRPKNGSLLAWMTDFGAKHNAAIGR